MTGLLVVLLLTAVPCPGNGQKRSSAAKTAFKKLHPCPGGVDKGSTKKCKGYVIDHICPLACCGLDAPQNMQWQTVDGAKLKDKTELDCKLCRKK